MGALATERNLPLRRSRPAKEVFQPDAAAITINGEIVLIDTNVGRLNGKVPCVVVRGDGTIGIEKPRNSLKFWCTGERGGYYDVRDHPAAKGGMASVACVILGRIVGPEPQSHYEAPDRIERLAQELSAAISSEYGGDYSVTIKSSGEVDYRWGAPKAA